MDEFSGIEGKIRLFINAGTKRGDWIVTAREVIKSKYFTRDHFLGCLETETDQVNQLLIIYSLRYPEPFSFLTEPQKSGFEEKFDEFLVSLRYFFPRKNLDESYFSRFERV